jgi:hypothetical protein
MGEQGGILNTISKYMSYSGITFDETLFGGFKTWEKITEKEEEPETKTEVDLLSDKLSELRK